MPYAFGFYQLAFQVGISIFPGETQPLQSMPKGLQGWATPESNCVSLGGTRGLFLVFFLGWDKEEKGIGLLYSIVGDACLQSWIT